MLFLIEPKIRQDSKIQGLGLRGRNSYKQIITERFCKVAKKLPLT